MALSEKIQAEIDKRFADPDRTIVRDLLTTLDNVRDSEQVRLAVLRLSRGKVKRVEDLVEAAKGDYRDVLAWGSKPTRKYVVGLLRKGPNWTDEDQKRCTHLHINNLRSWKDAGAITIGGMFVDFTDPRGLYIFTVDTIEEAQSLVQSDEGIRIGKLIFEFHPWLAPDGLRVASFQEL